jgi:hypothetical protein
MIELSGTERGEESAGGITGYNAVWQDYSVR